MRNPVGPLPSSIYWRRRAVVLALLVSLALLVAWAVGSGGSDDENRSDQGGKQGDDRAVSSITPGPSSTESLIGERPGGRDETGGGSGGPGGSGDSGSDGTGDGDGEGAEGTGGTEGSDADGPQGGPGTGGGGAGAGAPGGAEAVPAGSSLPECRPDSVEVTLSGTENRYAPGEKPTFHLTVRNGGDSDCKVDLGSDAVVFTITEAGDGDEKVWTSEHCPKGARSAFYRVPADGTAVRTLEWDRRHSTPECGTPGDRADVGTYLVEAEVAGLDKMRVSFVLTKD
nr:hypothetical protein [Streptomyces taklimakanensis]